ncbi:MAG: helix-turn-helix transcriptional regulator [Candidatus Accumulibacter sp.]|nr:helix-turn-helix transcriptional regulator [Candidatus Accumulibacter necessarius]
MTGIRFSERDGKREFAVIPIELYECLAAALEDADDAALADAAYAVDDGFRIPAAVVNALLEGEQPVRVWREQRGLTQDALAAKAGISKAYLCQIETRKRVGALKTLRAIADAPAVSVPDLTSA